MDKQLCDFKLAADLGGSCESPSVAGLMNNAVILNFDDVDWDAITWDESNPNVITNLPLKAGKRAYAAYMPGKTPYTGTNKTFTEGTYRNKFTKTVAMVILDNGPEVAAHVIDPLANGRFVAIMENKYQGEDHRNTFEVYGLEQGLSANELTDDKYSEDTDGGWAVSLQEVNAPRSGLYLFADSVAATRTLVENMLKATT